MPSGSDFASVLKGLHQTISEPRTNMNMHFIGSLIIEHAMFNESKVSQAVPLRSRLRILGTDQVKY